MIDIPTSIEAEYDIISNYILYLERLRTYLLKAPATPFCKKETKHLSGHYGPISEFNHQLSRKIWTEYWKRFKLEQKTKKGEKP